ncbi:hypothetical protein CDG77_04075 [Nostoc sp. 'Peltigera membranacea cyanobiont' 213]|uniref:DUF6887 family protein n=1 Tax=Nostoc sp. 'Peltigera membranacea cyanobiont' 213 TaxID=2014530 RepID=UPI000B959BED|nr:hypothetical protein [Nostoc sp. 'Peltigera membranacea cyanobiont' 213]OYD98837.1 hypothetical protein CDG77_04075 [Nostoc sp. 'Peltigera membranacea cyanobiont' 213]
MTQPDYKAMSDKDLLAYVRSHPEDTEAFHTYMDRLAARLGVVCTTEEEIQAELSKRINKSH